MAQKYQKQEIVEGVVSFLEENSEQGLLAQVTDDLKLLSEKDRQVNTAYLETYQTIAPEQIKQIKDKLEAITKHIITVKDSVDKTLLGGFKITLGDWVYDASLNCQLKLLKDQLYESI